MNYFYSTMLVLIGAFLLRTFYNEIKGQDMVVKPLIIIIIFMSILLILVGLLGFIILIKH